MKSTYILISAAPVTSSTSSHPLLTPSTSVTLDRGMIMDRSETIITNNAEFETLDDDDNVRLFKYFFFFLTWLSFACVGNLIS